MFGGFVGDEVSFTIAAAHKRCSYIPSSSDIYISDPKIKVQISEPL